MIFNDMLGVIKMTRPPNDYWPCFRHVHICTTEQNLMLFLGHLILDIVHVSGDVHRL